ncbi:hypothetical protein E7Z59_05880 [Robertkochia marina]|uniref:Uncharacterized protein n=1 Tax=Robertkochia marina TaxID=1227945 RepID=A0A4S3M4S7_9FLAO|nr:hypothetical protein [Robertkochia marina]THD69855.1 hypothetical protein E7Z59_05880 [Robertkochia marina]TRZ46800.1 hypothetical protein D3A96_04330 [Robertkochia marina]
MNDLNEQALQDLHEESVAWKSELNFCQDEYSFFEKLLNSYKYVPDNKEDFELQEDLLHSFKGLKDTGLRTYEVLLDHINKLGGIYEKEHTGLGSLYYREHESVKDQILAFKDEFRDFKRKLFTLADRILESKKPNGPTS